MSEKLSVETRALMGTFAAAEAALAEAAAVWRQFRQPRVDTAAGHKKADAMEREAQFRLANAALLWLWHVEERAARAEARPAPIDSAPRDGSWIVGWRANFRPFPTRWHPYSAPGGLGPGWWGGEPTHWLPFPTEQTFEDAEK